MHPTSLIASALGAGAVLLWRIRETQSPVTARTLLLPPLGMATGFAMFAAPPMRVPWSWGVGAFVVGAALFSYPLVATSTMTREGDHVMLKRSKAFLWILLGLIAVRLALRSWVEEIVSPTQTAALFFILAFGMLLPWRVTMFLRYRSLTRDPSPAG